MISVPLVQDLVEIEGLARDAATIRFERLLFAIDLQHHVLGVRGDEFDVARTGIGL